MDHEVNIRECDDPDLEAVLAFYPAAFPDEDLLPLVRSLAGRRDVVSFVALRGERVIGHVAFTQCRLGDDGRDAALLGPLAVDPVFARQGVGGQLVHTGIDAMGRRGAAAILVLGDPAYYSRFGFEPERDVVTPYPLREEWTDAWQSVWISDRRPNAPAPLIVPDPWRDQALWM